MNYVSLLFMPQRRQVWWSKKSSSEAVSEKVPGQ
jgi:hypothetical protein